MTPSHPLGPSWLDSEPTCLVSRDPACGGSGVTGGSAGQESWGGLAVRERRNQSDSGRKNWMLGLCLF